MLAQRAWVADQQTAAADIFAGQSAAVRGLAESLRARAAAFDLGPLLGETGLVPAPEVTSLIMPISTWVATFRREHRPLPDLQPRIREVVVATASFWTWWNGLSKLHCESGVTAVLRQDGAVAAASLDGEADILSAAMTAFRDAAVVAANGSAPHVGALVALAVARWAG